MPDVAGSLLYSLYGPRKQPVVLASENSAEYEDLVVAVFGQQWPRLRRAFSFCTGVLAIRDVSFDLSIAPGNIVQYDKQGLIFVVPTDYKTMQEQSKEDWVKAASDDLAAPEQRTELRRFLWKFGPDYNEGRSAFQALCEIYLASSRSTDSTEQVLSATAHFFPNPNSGGRLKAEFFGADESADSPRQRESLILRVLITHPLADCVSPEVMAIRQRAQRLLGFDPENARALALAALSIGGKRAEEYLSGFASGVVSRPHLLHNFPVSLTLELVKRQPGLLTSKEFWQLSSEQQMDFNLQISSLGIDPSYSKTITQAVVDAEAWQSLPTMFAVFKSDAVAAVFDWIDAIPQTDLSLPLPLVHALADERYQVLSLIRDGQLGPRSLRVASSFMDPRADVVRALGLSKWSRLANSGIQLTWQNAELHSLAFQLSLGLSTTGEGGVVLVRQGFGAVYEASRNCELGDRLWAFVEPYLPWYLVEWDRCARLVRGVVAAFVKRQWPFSEFVSTFVTDEQFNRALDEARRSRRGSRFVDKLLERVRNGSVNIGASRLEILSRYR
jgi:hypothetical protein